MTKKQDTKIAQLREQIAMLKEKIRELKLEHTIENDKHYRVASLLRDQLEAIDNEYSGMGL